MMSQRLTGETPITPLRLHLEAAAQPQANETEPRKGKAFPHSTAAKPLNVVIGSKDHFESERSFYE